MQKIWIVQIPEDIDFSVKDSLLKNLPKPLWNRANRYLDNESSLSYITGRLLLKKALANSGFSVSLLEKIHYSAQGKPSFTDCNFSISHSNRYVSLIFGTEFSVGIDIEKKKSIDLELFKYLFTEGEWTDINEAEDSFEKFYWFWVRKESLLKAADCALKDLKELEVLEHYGMCKGVSYYFTPFDFDTDFNGIVATEEKVDFEVEFMELEDL